MGDTGSRAALVLGLLLIAAARGRRGVALGAGPYMDRLAYERASDCAASASGDRDDCVGRVAMTVVSRSTSTTRGHDLPEAPQPPPPPPQPPQPPLRMIRPDLVNEAVVLAAARSDTLHHLIVARTADGRRHRFEVDHELYEVAEPGTSLIGETWHGRIVELRVGARTDGEWSYTRLQFGHAIAWTGLMLIVGFGLPLADYPRHIMLFVWWFGVMASMVIVGWRTVTWTMPAVVAGAFLAYRLLVTVRVHRQRTRFGG